MTTSNHPLVRAPAIADVLESRRLLAANVSASIVNDVLTVLGTRVGDSIVVAQAGPGEPIAVTIRAYGAGSAGEERLSESFSPEGLIRVFIDGDNGADVLDARGMKDPDMPVLIYGNAKSDKIYGGAGNDTLRGGSGNDFITGGGGNDLIDGDGGDDYANGNTGSDRVAGYYGNDTLVGGDGTDRLYGERDDDSLEGGDGRDYLYGDDGNDTLAGGAGAVDVLYGNAGDDLLIVSSRRAYVDGGSGTDTGSKDDETDYRPTSIELLA